MEEDSGASVLTLEGDFEQGTYRCRAGEELEAAEFDVKHLFKLVKWQRSEVVFHGEDLKLYCKLRKGANARGNPVFKWYTKDENAEVRLTWVHIRIYIRSQSNLTPIIRAGPEEQRGPQGAERDVCGD